MEQGEDLAQADIGQRIEKLEKFLASNVVGDSGVLTWKALFAIAEVAIFLAKNCYQTAKTSPWFSAKKEQQKAHVLGDLWGRTLQVQCLLDEILGEHQEGSQLSAKLPGAKGQSLKAQSLQRSIMSLLRDILNIAGAGGMVSKYAAACDTLFQRLGAHKLAAQ